MPQIRAGTINLKKKPFLAEEIILFSIPFKKHLVIDHDTKQCATR